MSETSRRGFLAVTGAGVAAGAVVGGAGAAAAAVRPQAARESVVAYVADHWSDEVRLMVGEEEVVVHDRDLVVRILNAAGGQ